MLAQVAEEIQHLRGDGDEHYLFGVSRAQVVQEVRDHSEL